MSSYIRHVDVCLIVKQLFSVIGDQNVIRPIQVEKLLIPAVASQVATLDGKPYEVVVECKNWQAYQLSGWLFRYPQHAEIYYSASLKNTCWSRWVVCKELAHLLIDTEEKHFTKNPEYLVQELINKLPSVKFDHEMNSEMLAGVAAIEMLLPWKYRPEMEKMMAEGKSDYDIAYAFRAPEKFVNLLLRSPYGKTSAASNSAHGSAPIQPKATPAA